MPDGAAAQADIVPTDNMAAPADTVSAEILRKRSAIPGAATSHEDFMEMLTEAMRLCEGLNPETQDRGAVPRGMPRRQHLECQGEMVCVLGVTPD